MKWMAERYFKDRFNAWGVTPQSVLSTPTPFNVLSWRGIARDDEHYYVTYWSLFDAPGRDDSISQFTHGHQLETDFKESEEYQAIKWFTMGWRKTYQREDEPDSIYIAALMMGEMRVSNEDKTVMKPPFIWKITTSESGFVLERPHKMSKDIWQSLGDAGNAITVLSERVMGKQEDWMDAEWIWDQ